MLTNCESQYVQVSLGYTFASRCLQARPEELSLDHFISLCRFLDTGGGAKGTSRSIVAAADSFTADADSEDTL